MRLFIVLLVVWVVAMFLAWCIFHGGNRYKR